MRRLAVALSAFGLSYSAHLFALEPAFTIQQGLFGYRSTNTKTTPSGGSALTDKETSVYTTPNNLLLYATLEKLAFYVSPTQPGAPVGIGYYLKPELELGLNLAYNTSSKDTASASTPTKVESKSQVIAPYVTYYRSVSKTQLELTYSPVLISSSSKTKNKATGAVLSESQVSGMAHFINVLALYPLGKNLFYGAGLDVTSSSTKESKGSKEKVSSTAFNLNLATLRFNF